MRAWIPVTFSGGPFDQVEMWNWSALDGAPPSKVAVVVTDDGREGYGGAATYSRTGEVTGGRHVYQFEGMHLAKGLKGRGYFYTPDTFEEVNVKALRHLPIQRWPASRKFNDQPKPNQTCPRNLPSQ
jgi:hypothetical protein